MGIQIKILNFILTIEAFFVSFFKVKKNRVTFISLESNELNSDFLLIYDQLKQHPCDIKLCLIKYNKNLFGQLLYFFNCLKQLYLINTSHIVILHDNNFVVSNYKREGVIVLQVWHACGAIKKFGNCVKRKYPIHNYDYVLATSSYWKNPYSQAFSVQEDHVLPVGMPRCDELFDTKQVQQNQEKLYAKYPFLKGKKIILYAPTFRGNIYDGFSAVPFDANKILKQLGDEYILLYKFHPLMPDSALDSHPNVYNMNKEDTHALFSVTDYLISDYSSIVFDYLILQKPLLFFVPDLEEYSSSLGVFVDLKELNCPVCFNELEIIQAIQENDFDISQLLKLKNTFFDEQDDQSTQRVVEFLIKKLKD